MKKDYLDKMTKGWIVGDFQPSVIQSKDFEVGVKRYTAGDREACHYHKIALEVTVVVSGTVRMLDKTWNAGDIITLDPGEATEFEALTDAVCTVVKIPSVRGDKYLV